MREKNIKYNKNKVKNKNKTKNNQEPIKQRILIYIQP